MFEHWRFKNHLALFVEGSLIGMERKKFKRHLITCSRCRTESETMIRLLKGLKSDSVQLPVKEIWDALPAGIRKAVEHEKNHKSVKDNSSIKNPRAIWLVPAVGFSIILFLALVSMLISGGPPKGGIPVWSSADTEALIIELARIDEEVLDEVIGPEYRYAEGWMVALSEAGEDDLAEIFAYLKTSEERIWPDPVVLEKLFLEKPLKEVTS